MTLCILLSCFLDAQPTDGEREVWNQISAVLQDSESMLADLQAYKGAGQEIRDVCLLKINCSSLEANPNKTQCVPYFSSVSMNLYV